ncbi:transposase [Candidatus Uhrbacteria bacterium]|nr:transposase [Candidatus Uhrbacteria bacterium]
MTFKDSHQEQNFLLPPSYGDFLGESHEAVALKEFMSEIDTTALIQSYNNQNGGRAAYHPAMLLSLLVYGYMNGIFSSRKIAKLLRQDLAFMYLAGNNTPDFRTLARFRKEKGIYLENIFAIVVKKASNLGFVTFGTCSLDGTKIYANASKTRNYNRAEVEENIRKIMKEADAIDTLEDAMYGNSENAMDPELNTKEGRQKRKKELQAKQKNEEVKLQKIAEVSTDDSVTNINITDPDAHFMKMKRSDYANGYNVQVISENGVILSNCIFNTSADQGTLIASVQKLQQTRQAPRKLLTDKGYSSEDNYTFCEQAGIDAYIPNYSEPTNLSGFVYDEIRDTYTDAKGRKYVFKQHMEKRAGAPTRKQCQNETSQNNHAYYKRTIYEYRNARTKKKKYLAIAPLWQRHVKKMKEKLSSLDESDKNSVSGRIYTEILLFIYQNSHLRESFGTTPSWAVFSLT